MDLNELLEQRKKAVADARSILETAETEKRDLTSEEEQSYDRANRDIDALDAKINRGLEDQEREARTADLEERASRFRPADSGKRNEPEVDGFEKDVRDFLSGERRDLTVSADPSAATDHTFDGLRDLVVKGEHRTLSKLTAAAGANTVPTSFYNQLIAHMIEVSGILAAGPTVLRTSSGEQIQLPKTTAHGTAALTAEASAFSASDPTFGQVPLDAYKYGLLLKVSRELIEDTAVDLLGYLAMQAGRAVGNALGTHLITGTGSNQPNGLVTAATLGVTGAASVSGAFTADNLIDLMFSVISPYRSSPSCGWLVRDASLAAIRKLKDSQNQYLWQPSIQVGAPDVLLGKPVHTDPNVAAVALSAKSVIFGDISQYFVRIVNAIRFERSDDFAFDSDLVTFRCAIRADGDLPDTTGAVKYFQGNAA